MNIKRFDLDELELSRDTLKDALRVIIHAVVLGRSLGGIRPAAPRQCSVLRSISYCRMGEPAVDTQIEEGINNFITGGGIIPVGQNVSRGTLVLSFYESRTQVAMFGMVTNEERIVWEMWTIPVVVVNAPLGSSLSSSALNEIVRDVRGATLKIATWLISPGNSDHVPPPPKPTSKSSCYTFELRSASSFPSSSSSASSTAMGLTSAVGGMLGGKDNELARWVSGMLTSR